MLTGPEIERQIAAGRIAVTPYDAQFVGSNSIDVHLHPALLTYARLVLDARKANPVNRVVIPVNGCVRPGVHDGPHCAVDGSRWGP